MPYIANNALREALDRWISAPWELGSGVVKPQTPGELEFVICRLVDNWLQWHGREQPPYHGVKFEMLNAAVGVLETTKLEFVRRVLAPYEDRKREESGDVFTD